MRFFLLYLILVNLLVAVSGFQLKNRILVHKTQSRMPLHFKVPNVPSPTSTELADKPRKLMGTFVNKIRKVIPALVLSSALLFSFPHDTLALSSGSRSGASSFRSSTSRSSQSTTRSYSSSPRVTNSYSYSYSSPLVVPSPFGYGYGSGYGYSPFGFGGGEFVNGVNCKLILFY